MSDEEQAIAVADDPGLVELTNEQKIEALGERLKQAVYVWEPDELMTVSAASDLVVQTPEDYARGHDLLKSLADIGDSIDTWYSRFKAPLTKLGRIVDAGKRIDTGQLDPVKDGLAARLGTWKVARDRADAIAKARAQAEADAKARAEQQAKADAVRRIAEAESDAALKASFEREARSIAAVPVMAAPVEIASSVPKVAGAGTKMQWTCVFDDVKLLMQAWVEGRCVLDEQGVIDDGLQKQMDVQATALTTRLWLAYPGCRAQATPKATSKRR